jgi:hypothetical protein
VDSVRRVIDAFNRRDRDALLELMDRETDFTSALVEERTYRGSAGARSGRQGPRSGFAYARVMALWGQSASTLDRSPALG